MRTSCLVLLSCLAASGRSHAADFGYMSLKELRGLGQERPRTAEGKALQSPAADLRKAAAEAGIELPAAATAYEMLAALFEGGTRPSQEEATGWRAGRGFSASDPNNPTAELLAGGYVAELPGGGPLFGAKVFKLASLRSAAGPDYFDDMDAEGVKAVKSALSQAMADADFFNGKEFAFSSREAAASGPVVPRGGECRVRSFGNYLILKGERGYAYYFRKVGESASLKDGPWTYRDAELLFSDPDRAQAPGRADLKGSWTKVGWVGADSQDPAMGRIDLRGVDTDGARGRLAFYETYIKPFQHLALEVQKEESDQSPVLCFGATCVSQRRNPDTGNYPWELRQYSFRVVGTDQLLCRLTLYTRSDSFTNETAMLYILYARSEIARKQ